MEIPVLLEPVENNAYRAKSGPPFDVTAEGATREEAVAKVREEMESKLKKGAQLTSIQWTGSPTSNPWFEFAGMFQDDPMFENWQRAIVDYRNEVEADPNYP